MNPEKSSAEYLEETMLVSAELGCGVAPCHAADNFSRKLGRIMSKGRLLKLIRKLRCLSGDSPGDEDVDSADRSSTDYRDSAERLSR